MENISTAPAILFALGREAGPFLHDFPERKRVVGASCRVTLCGPVGLPVLFVETGVGRERMEKALAWVLSKPMIDGVSYLPRLVISAGFSGALQEDLGVGDIVVATEVIDATGHCLPATWPEDLSGIKQPAWRRGRLVDLGRFVTDAQEKESLGRQHGALAVDMETATVARTCHRHGIPFGCVRAISDDARSSLPPELDAIVINGRVRPFRLLRYLCRRPILAIELVRLAKNTRCAAGSLALALREMLT